MNGLLPPSPEVGDYLDLFAYQVIQTAPGTPERRVAWRALAIGTAACIEEMDGRATADALNDGFNSRLSWAAAEAGREKPPEEMRLEQKDWNKFLYYARALVDARAGYRTPDALAVVRGFATGKLRILLRPDDLRGRHLAASFVCQAGIWRQRG
jgi:hypothetical protein